MTPTTAIIAPSTVRDLDAPSSAVPTTAVLDDRVAPLDPDEPDAVWEERVLAACAPRRRVLGLRD